MAPLPWLPKSLVDQTGNWNFDATVKSSMGSLLQSGQDLMKPVGQQLADVVSSAGQGLGSAASTLGSGMASLAPAPAQRPEPMGQPQPSPQLPEIKPFALPSLETFGMGPRAQPAAPSEPPSQPGTSLTSQAGQPIELHPAQPSASMASPSPSLPTLGFSLPGLGGWGMTPSSRSAPTAAAFPSAAGAPSAAPTGSRGAPSQPGEIEAYIRSAAARRGIDPDVAVKVAQSEGGLDDPVRQSDYVYRGAREESYGPLQLNVQGGVGSAALKAGIDPRDPSQWRQAVDFGLDEVARSGWGQWHGAARVGVGNQQGIGTYHGPVPEAPVAARPAAAQRSAQPSSNAPRPGSYTPENIAPNQYTEGMAQGLSAEEALAICGPAAAVAFSRANGRNPTVREAKELAQQAGVWDVGSGMHGPASEVALLGKMGIDANLQQGADWTRVAQEVQAGRPVIIDTPNHYYVASGYDPQTGEFEFGQSAAVLRSSKGRTRFKPQDIASLGMGSPRATIFLGGGS